MKILIVDDRAETKCIGIIEECKKRGIEVEIRKGRNSALRRIICEEQDIAGIILDMELPIYDDGFPKKTGGDRILRELCRMECNIPVLIFSSTQSNFKDECEFVVDQMTDWYIVQEQEKLFLFLDILKSNSN